MSKIFKAARLDFALLKYYIKSICFTLLVPLAFVAFYRTLAVGISFAMFMMSMASIYTFSVAEKNDMQRLYGLLPVSISQLVCGKYLHVFLMGLAALILSVLIQPLILIALGTPVTLQEIAAAAAAGLVLFITYICFQIPGYYKFGPIKGKVLMYVPVIGILLTMFAAGNADFSSLFLFLSENPLLLPCIILVYLILIASVSIKISINIVKKKEW